MDPLTILLCSLQKALNSKNVLPVVFLENVVLSEILVSQHFLELLVPMEHPDDLEPHRTPPAFLRECSNLRRVFPALRDLEEFLDIQDSQEIPEIQEFPVVLERTDYLENLENKDRPDRWALLDKPDHLEIREELLRHTSSPDHQEMLDLQDHGDLQDQQECQEKTDIQEHLERRDGQDRQEHLDLWVLPDLLDLWERKDLLELLVLASVKIQKL